ncbi:beta-ketoacyl-[acyl-carrier-protein] synthase family protein [Streptomyces yerevanensis]|uniref:beta-ketoacyl-[acyl-carrier-protein] synthase family protein n=1 Tax=Streptomyces yerevanensis TaxID=66378 RepID=UPI000525DAC5|nr:beta-ketoacyl-[acyl-carrier-protein] synthase family protein [Streptomyces yerevanensis]
MSTHRVVITGMGVRTAAGDTPDAVWAALAQARSAAGPVRSFDVPGFPVDVACEIRDFDPGGYLTPKQAARADRSAQLAFCAAADAITDAGGLAAGPGRRAVVTGTAYGGEVTREQALLRHVDGVGRPRPMNQPMVMSNAGAALISMAYGIGGPSLTLSTACASGAHAVGEAAQLVRAGVADVVVAGGHDTPLTPTTMLAMYRLGALATGFADPAQSCRPFDAGRKGFVMGEGAAFVVLERLASAQARGARVYAEVAGYGRTSDAHHLTAPHPEGAGARSCMAAALTDAGVTAQEVVHVNAHGTGTELNDLVEARAITSLFGPGQVPVTAPKSVTGHTIGAAGAIEAVVAALSVAEGLAPPTANLTELDPRCEVDVVTGAPRKLPSGPVLSNSFAFGGHNASLLLAPVGVR